jgi:hypothetical protein
MIAQSRTTPAIVPPSPSRRTQLRGKNTVNAGRETSNRRADAYGQGNTGYWESHPQAM